MATRSPIRTSASGGTLTTPCSSLSRTTSQSSWPQTHPKEAGGSATSIRSDVSTFEPASTTIRSGAGRATTVATANAARSSGPQAPCAIWLRSLKTYVPGRTSVTPGQRIAKRNVPAEPTETTGAGEPAGADLLGRLDREPAGLERHPLPLGVVARLRVDVALVREDAGELEPVERRDPLREVDGSGTGEDAEAVHARVELEQRPDRRARARARLRAIPAATSSESTVTVIATRSARSASRPSFCSPTIG